MGLFLWGKNFSGGGANDQFYGALGNADGSIILAGESEASSSGDFGAWAVGLDSAGGRIWQRSYDISQQLRAVLGIDGDDLVMAGGTTAWLLQTLLEGEVDDCSLVETSNRNTTPLAITAQAVDLPVSNSAAVPQQVANSGYSVTLTRNSLCPNVIEGGGCR